MARERRMEEADGREEANEGERGSNETCKNKIRKSKREAEAKEIKGPEKKKG